MKNCQGDKGFFCINIFTKPALVQHRFDDFRLLIAYKRTQIAQHAGADSYRACAVKTRTTAGKNKPDKQKRICKFKHDTRSIKTPHYQTDMD
jgi:hypothetical protein